MSVSLETDVANPLCEGQCSIEGSISKNSLRKNDLEGIINNDVDESKDEKTEPETPKPYPMAFTVDFGDTKQIDKQKLEQLARQSQARHQRVQSMSASLTKTSPVTQKPPMSAKLPRKAQGYNSEGYFSSDQEDSVLSGSVKLRQSPLAQNIDLKTHITSPVTTRNVKSPINDTFQTKVKTSKSPIVDSIMSRSDTLPSRQSLNLPLKHTNNSYVKDVHRTPSYGNLSNHPRYRMADIMDQSPEGIMLTDISSPELEVLTPDNGLSTPDIVKPVKDKTRRAVSETPDDLFKKCIPKIEPLYIDDDVDRQSNNSSTGTYTIEGDNYTEEQKARMSIDRSFGTDRINNAVDEALKKRSVSSEKDPELIFDYTISQRVITEEPRGNLTYRCLPQQTREFDVPKVSKDKNVLEISCCYESPTETDLAVQTSKQIKSTRSYLEKIKNRVKTITEKTFAKSPPKHIEDQDVGSFTSVTTSGVLSSKNPLKPDNLNRRRCSLTKSEIDQTDYVHRLSRESSVPVSLPSNKSPLEDAKFESTALRNAQAKALKDDSGVSSDITPEQVVGKLSYLSLNRCKGDKTWIQDWAESVKKYNSNSASPRDDLNTTFSMSDSERPPLSPRHISSPGKGLCNARATHPSGSTPTKIPSPLGTLQSRSKQEIPATAQDTETYLLKTQNAISNLQAKLQSSRTNNFATNIPSQLTSSLISEKTLVSRLPVSQLSRSNSLNYRLRRKDHSGENSPLRSPGHYVITGSTGLPASSKLVINSASRSLEADRRRDSNRNSPSSDRGLLSNSSDEKTLSCRPAYDVNAILSPHRKAHARRKSFDCKNPKEYFVSEPNSKTVSLKTVLKNNALDAQNLSPRNIDQMKYHSDGKRFNHQRGLSDGTAKPKNMYQNFGNSIKRSSSFNTVNKNNNYLDSSRMPNSRRSSDHSEIAYKDLDYMSDESDNGSYDKSQETRYKRPTNRGRIDSPDLKSIAPSNSPRCPNTPEMHRKFGPNLIRNSALRAPNGKLSEQTTKPSTHQSRRISEPNRQAVFTRLTKSRSSTREFQPKNPEKGAKKPAQYRSSSALATKEIEFSNWKKRSSYDPMKAAQEGRKRQQQTVNSKRLESNKDDFSSPSHSSPVHRSQSFHSTNLADLEVYDYSSEGTEDEKMVSALPMDHPMITSTHSDILETRPRSSDYREALRRQVLRNDVVLSRDYVTNYQVNQHTDKKRGDIDKRKTFIVDDVTPTKDNIELLIKLRGKGDGDAAIDKRKTFILDSDTNSTTNGSSPRTSSIFSQEKSLTTATSDTEGESGTESAPVMRRPPNRRAASASHGNKRFSGDFSMSSSTTSIGREQQKARDSSKKDIQPRYLDISKYKSENSSKNFLRRDPSKTYVNVLGNHSHPERAVSKGSAQHYEMEQKKQELEKWKRRASYDPRKAAAQGKVTAKTPTKTASSVLRSQSFHGPMLTGCAPRVAAAANPTTGARHAHIAEADQSSDNDF